MTLPPQKNMPVTPLGVGVCVRCARLHSYLSEDLDMTTRRHTDDSTHLPRTYTRVLAKLWLKTPKMSCFTILGGSTLWGIQWTSCFIIYRRTHESSEVLVIHGGVFFLFLSFFLFFFLFFFFCSFMFALTLFIDILWFFFHRHDEVATNTIHLHYIVTQCKTVRMHHLKYQGCYLLQAKHWICLPTEDECRLQICQAC